RNAMCVSLRRFSAIVLGVLALAVSASRPSVGQQPTATPGTTVTPVAPRGQFPNTAVLGKNPVNAPANPGGLGYGSLAPGSSPDTGYGTLSNTYANSGQGYGSLVNSNSGGYNASGYGAYGMAGLGWGTQWMINPYEGYLSGAAAVTNANAQYQLTIQQAKIVR